MKPMFPSNIESLDRNWLTHVLLHSGQLESGGVAGFKGEKLDGGYTSTVFRLLLSYESPHGMAPESAVIKFHSESRSIRKTFEYLGIYEKEVRFYQFIDPALELPVPACYAAEYDPDSGDFVLLLQDLSAARPGSWELDPVGDIKTAIPQLAKIHAQFWGNPRLEHYDWIVESTKAPISDVTRIEWSNNLAQVKSEHRGQWPDHIWQTCVKIEIHWDSIMKYMNQGTHTLVHTDSHLGQMFFPTEELPHYYLFDWQFPCKALAAEDVAHLIINDLSVEDRREHESGLIDLYFESLCQHGVTGISRDQLWFQCKLSLMWVIVMNFRTITDPDLLQILQAEADEDEENWQDWIFGLFGPTIEDWDFSGAIDQAIKQAES
jgi:hypothetical protein